MRPERANKRGLNGPFGFSKKLYFRKGNTMATPKLEKLEKRIAESRAMALVSGIAIVGFAILSRRYSYLAENERLKDPEYRAEQERIRAERQRLREQELETQRRKYEYEQEKLKLEAENRKLDKEREKAAEAIEKIDKYHASMRNLDDYGLVDAAYSILDILKGVEPDNPMRYRALSCLSDFVKQAGYTDTKRRITDIMNTIEAM